ncbi:MAG: transcriptional regulator [Polyangiaceae bacterium]|nr:transcriptional regulator [Polyangiaceae bacterium]
MPLPKNFQNFAEFEREILRGSNRIGLSLEDIVEDTSFDAELDFERDPFDAMDDNY